MQTDSNVEIVCEYCKGAYLRSMKWFSPKEFSKEPVSQNTHFCPKCNLSNTIQVRYLDDSKIEYVKHISIKSLFIDKF